jgi:hypothetical protein
MSHVDGLSLSALPVRGLGANEMCDLRSGLRLETMHRVFDHAICRGHTFVLSYSSQDPTSSH